MTVSKDISKLIDNPVLCNAEHTELLKDFSTKYPFSSLFSILYLKSLSNSSDLQFEDELRKHSFRISNREQLYHIIQEHSEKTDDKIKNEQNIIEKNTSFDENETKEEKHLEENLTETQPDSTDIIDSETIHSTEVDPIEKTILQHAIASNYKLDDLTEEEILALEEKNNSSEKKNHSTEEEIPKIELSIDTKQSFKEWLSANQNYKKSKTEPLNTASLKTLINEEPQKEAKTKKELLEEVKKPKKAFFSPIEKAKESLNEDVLPVSETLAKIYALQGNFPKAISAYMQLSLINPEKKVFFALRIKELEQKIKQK